MLYLNTCITNISHEHYICQWQIQDFPCGGRAPTGGCGPPTWVLFGENACENERIGSNRGRVPGTPPRSANVCNQTRMYVFLRLVINKDTTSELCTSF